MVRDLVWTRARGRCERCGRDPGEQLHHRKPRRMGGTRDPAINEATNLVLLCEECHLRGVEIERLAGMAWGYILSANADPAKVGVRIYARGFVYLTSDGKYSATAPD